MLLSTILASTALAASASAFTINAEKDSNINAIPAQQISQLSPTVIEVACPGCGFFVEHDEPYEWIDDIESALRLNFTTVFATNNHEFLLNDVIFHPLNHTDIPNFYAPLIRKSNIPTLPRSTVPIRLGYTLQTLSPRKDGDRTILEIRFTILDLADRAINLDGLAVKLWLDTDNSITAYMIGPYGVNSGWTASRDRRVIVDGYLRVLYGAIVAVAVVGVVARAVWWRLAGSKRVERGEYRVVGEEESNECFAKIGFMGKEIVLDGNGEDCVMRYEKS